MPVIWSRLLRRQHLLLILLLGVALLLLGVLLLFPTDSPITGPLVIDQASLTPPGSQFRAPSRLLLKITDYLSLLPTFPGSDNCTQGVPVPWYG